MAWNGSGTFSRTNGVHTGTGVWADDKAAGAKILASRHDTHDQDVATGINACLTKNGENTPSAHLSYLNTQSYVSSTGGSSNAYTVTLSPAATAYYSGMTLRVIWNHTNTGAATLNVNGLGAKDIRRMTGQVLIGDECPNGTSAVLVYNGSEFILLTESPRMPIGPFSYTFDIIANMNVDLVVGSYSSGVTGIYIPGGKVATAISVKLAAAQSVSAGTMTLTLYVNSVSTSKSITLTTGQGRAANLTSAHGINNGDVVGIRMQTDGSFAGSTTITNLAAYLWVY